MKRPRRNYSVAFNSKVALGAVNSGPPLVKLTERFDTEFIATVPRRASHVRARVQ
jgi:hypothetical protein